MSALEVGELQMGRDHAGFWWYCAACEKWGRHDRLSFVHTEANAHRKVVHHG